MTRRTVRTWTTVCLLGAVLGLAGCGKSDADIQKLTGHTPGEAPVPESKVVTYDGYVAEFKESVRKLQWPDGFQKPVEALNKDRSASYQVGLGEGDAVSVWQCAWSGVYLKNKDSDPVRAKAALKVYATIKTMKAWDVSFNDPNTRSVIETALSKAELGDGSALQQLYSANC